MRELNERKYLVSEASLLVRKVSFVVFRLFIFGIFMTIFVAFRGVIGSIVLYKVVNRRMSKTTEILIGGRV